MTNVHDVRRFFIIYSLRKDSYMTYLKPHEVQHPDPRLDELIKSIQYLIQTQQLQITKSGFDALMTQLIAERSRL